MEGIRVILGNNVERYSEQGASHPEGGMVVSLSTTGQFGQVEF